MPTPTHPRSAIARIEAGRRGISQDFDIFSDRVPHSKVSPSPILMALVVIHTARAHIFEDQDVQPTALAGEILGERFALAGVEDDRRLHEMMPGFGLYPYEPVGKIPDTYYNQAAWHMAAPLVHQEISLGEVAGLLVPAQPIGS